MTGRATVNLRVQPFRLLKRVDAAHYCARSAKTFETQCPVRPITMANGDVLWDVYDLDAWIDGLKAGASSDDKIIALLG